MATKLGEMLVEAGRLTVAQVGEALKSQVVFGGRLGTNLIEMGYLEEEELAVFLSRKMGLPCASTEQLMSVPPDVIRLVPKEMAENYHIIPLGLEKKRLTLAMLDPSDLPLIDEISFVTGYFIIPMIVPEMRMALALERHYGIKPEQRIVQYAEKIRARQQKEKPAPVAEGAGPVAPPPEVKEEIIDALDEIVSPAEPVKAEHVQMEPESVEPPVEEPVKWQPLIVEPVALYQVREETALPPPVRSEPVKTEPAQPEPPIVSPFRANEVMEEKPAPSPEKGEEPVKSAEALAERLAESKGREEIADLLVDYLGREFARVVLFMIRGNSAAGWRGMKAGKAISGMEGLQIALELPSVLKVVADGKSFYLGSIPNTPENARVLTGIGGDTPSSALLVPLMLMGRVVAIVYVDGGKAPLASRLAELQKLVGKASMAFEILILKNKILMT